MFSKEDNGMNSVYIGEAEKFKGRIVQHMRDYQKYYWDTAVIFVRWDLYKVFENRFVETARE